ncbi:hypothetical protein [Actinokineospora sp. NBRC 105648]|uniref:hypothetical protein n=1 Tax=Actinokineospora sp. NBRC 105648 TaxID=3032206 RepID=UPI0024A060D2|nr:hypothetical protein [Actinokineospora sp. NBRC 105648]GLZ36841.1 hypothetical protein Acsp05_04660 [Actinokineospora sp. NBRC 105648]
MTARAEIAKLARLLGDDPERFHYLLDVPEADLRRLREQATDVLFGANQALFERIGAASKLVPAALTASIAQRSFGALLSARVAGVLEPARAVDLAGRLSVGFLADVAAELDPRRVAGVLAVLPVARMLEVARELVRRGDHITMGRFVGQLPPPALRATVETLAAEDLLRTAVYSEVADRFAELFAMVADDRLPEVARVVATAPDDLAHDLLPLFARLDEPGLARVADAVAALPVEQRARFAKHAAEAGVLGGLGPLSAALSA